MENTSDSEILNEDETAVPHYGSKPKKPGIYLGLFHGRNSPLEPMEGWGFEGPAIGPLRWCHTTYAFDIKINFENAADGLTYFGVEGTEFELTMDADLIVFRGEYFGDWTVYFVKPEDCERPADSFRKTKRVNNFGAHRKHLIESQE
jgi:hypothetical protein